MSYTIPHVSSATPQNHSVKECTVLAPTVCPSLLPISIEILFVVAEEGGDWGKEIVLHQSQYIGHLTRVKWETDRQKDRQT